MVLETNPKTKERNPPPLPFVEVEKMMKVFLCLVINIESLSCSLPPL